jgi:prenylcysteine alpha-carboxyl methylesterase
LTSGTASVRIPVTTRHERLLPATVCRSSVASRLHIGWFCIGGQRRGGLTEGAIAFTSSDQNIRITEQTPQESRVAVPSVMQVEIAARASLQQGKAETPPPSPAASSAAEDAPLLPDGGVRRRAVCGRFAQRSGSFRREVGRAAAETFLLTRLTLILLRYLGYSNKSIPFLFSISVCATNSASLVLLL